MTADGARCLDGYHALVTGAASGIGRAVADDFARAGAAVTLLDRDARVAAIASQIVECGGRARAGVVDCGASLELRAAVELARSDFGRVSTVVHAAGIGLHQPLSAFSDELFDATFDVHVRALFALVSAVTPDWMVGGGGSLLAVTSPAAVRGQVDGGVYAAAKAAVIGAVRSIALELAPHNVRSNAILPMAATSMTEAVRSDPVLNATYLARVPLGRWGSPEEIAALCRFLAGPTGEFITGVVVPIDGGRTI